MHPTLPPSILRQLFHVIAASLLLSCCLALCVGCQSGEEYVKDEIKKAAACDADTDCIDVGGKCPFGCYVPVHKDNATRIKQLLDEYPSNCVYDCIELDQIICENKTCTAKTK